MLTALWLAVLSLPVLLAALLIVHHRTRRLALPLVPWAAVPSLVLSLWPGFEGYVEVEWLLLGTHFGLDTTGRVFLFLTALAWTIAAFYARVYMAHDRLAYRFYMLFLLSMSGNLGLIVAQDVAGFYLFFALMSLSAYGLIVHDGDRRALYAGRVYLIMAVIGEGLLLAAFMLIVFRAESLLLADVPAAIAAAPERDLILALLFGGFGIKAGTLPLHVWLPLAHPVAPTPASAVLSGCMIKAGLIGWLRFLPLGEVALPAWGTAWIAMGLVSAFFGVAIGLTQTDPKTALAYSSISQMGIINVGLGVGLLLPEAWPLALVACLIYALHHGLAKAALFLGVGVATARLTRPLQRRLVLAGLALPALALAGLPLTSGFVAKTALKDVTAGAPEPWLDLLDWLLPLAAAGTTLLMARFLALTWPRPRGDHPPEPGLWLPWSALLAGVAVAIWLVPGYYGIAVIEPALFAPGTVWVSVWPVLLGGALAVAAWELARRRRLVTAPEITPGDLLVLVEWAWARAGATIRRTPTPKPAAPVVWLGHQWYGFFTQSHERNLLERAETRLTSWSVAGLGFLGLLIALVAFLLAG